MDEEFVDTLKCAGFGEGDMVTCPDMLDCLLIKAGIIPQEDASLLELKPVDLGRQDSNTAYLDVSTTDSIIKVVAEFAKRDRRTMRRCLSDKLRHFAARIMKYTS